MLDERYVSRCVRYGVIIDTNLLVLLLLGSYDSDAIKDCNRTNSYSIDDYILILRIVEKSKKVVVTPHILAEISNLTFDLYNAEKHSIFFKEVIAFINATHEHYSQKSTLLNEPMILGKLGFADASLIHAVKEDQYLVLTDDGPLTQMLTTLGFDALNINHLRSYEWIN